MHSHRHPIRLWPPSPRTSLRVALPPSITPKVLDRPHSGVTRKLFRHPTAPAASSGDLLALTRLPRLVVQRGRHDPTGPQAKTDSGCQHPWKYTGAQRHSAPRANSKTPCPGAAPHTRWSQATQPRRRCLRLEFSLASQHKDTTHTHENGAPRRGAHQRLLSKPRGEYRRLSHPRPALLPDTKNRVSESVLSRRQQAQHVSSRPEWTPSLPDLA